MPETPEEAYEEAQEEALKRQWIENYKKYRRLSKQAEAELAQE